MAGEISTVTVYAGSSSQVDEVYFNAARQLGALLANNGIRCINGAGSKGLMAAVTDAVLQNGGEVIGIIPDFMVQEGWCHSELTERIVTTDIHKRKELMAGMSDACIALPGGIGTLEELSEIITWKQLGLYTGPIVILNVNGYYDELLKMLEKATKESFMHPRHADIWTVANDAAEAMEIILENSEWEANPRSIAAL
ncbi:MAG: TIGR00730 family Rossman fold protein [Bacteroidales bacterium]|nr:TIGR00730 family Rossman fold protein [Bacteroidales bacterium]